VQLLTFFDILALHLQIGLYLQETVAARSSCVTTAECAVGSVDVTLLRDAIKTKLTLGADLPSLILRLTQKPISN